MFVPYLDQELVFLSRIVNWFHTSLDRRKWGILHRLSLHTYQIRIRIKMPSTMSLKRRIHDACCRGIGQWYLFRQSLSLPSLFLVAMGLYGLSTLKMTLRQLLLLDFYDGAVAKSVQDGLMLCLSLLVKQPTSPFFLCNIFYLFYFVFHPFLPLSSGSKVSITYRIGPPH